MLITFTLLVCTLRMKEKKLKESTQFIVLQHAARALLYKS
jgi:hypothetical protein